MYVEPLELQDAFENRAHRGEIKSVFVYTLKIFENIKIIESFKVKSPLDINFRVHALKNHLSVFDDQACK